MLGLLVRQSSVNNDNRVFYEKMKRAPLETRCFFLVENVRGRDRNRKLICACPYRDQQAEANAIFMLRFRQSDCNMFRVQFVGSYQEAELCNDKRFFDYNFPTKLSERNDMSYENRAILLEIFRESD